jgi:dipeptidyl aminopeptidase/acylaminoacyl peptidase
MIERARIRWSHLHFASRFLAASVALTLTLLVSSSSALASVIRGGPRLAVSKNTLFPFRYDLETVDRRGARPLHLAGGGPRTRPLPQEFTPPSWSPDGSMLVFSGLARRADDWPRSVRLYISAADGSGLRPLKGTHGADEPKFAPDNRTVFFTRHLFRPRVNRQGKRESLVIGGSIWSVDVFGGVPRRITPRRKGVLMYPASFSPDGGTLLASRSIRREPWDVVKLQLDRGDMAVLLHGAEDPVYSPDGSRIAFVRWRRFEAGKSGDSWTSDIFTVRVGGGGLQRITGGVGNDYSQTWDPSGERLAFVRYPPERYDPDGLGYGSAVLQVNADGSCLSLVLGPSLDTAFFGVAWQPGSGREAGRIPC